MGTSKQVQLTQWYHFIQLIKWNVFTISIKTTWISQSQNLIKVSYLVLVAANSYNYILIGSHCSACLYSWPWTQIIILKAFVLLSFRNCFSAMTPQPFILHHFVDPLWLLQVLFNDLWMLSPFFYIKPGPYQTVSHSLFVCV